MPLLDLTYLLFCKEALRPYINPLDIAYLSTFEILVLVNLPLEYNKVLLPSEFNCT
nr:MAG TPA: hypothetical protein [Caudoviricetes sp.]